jgi:hypothetical protein
MARIERRVSSRRVLALLLFKEKAVIATECASPAYSVLLALLAR